MARYPELASKVAVITGAGRHKGLGEAMAARLAAEGCRVVIADLGRPQGDQFPDEAIGDDDEMRSVAESIRANGAEVHTVHCNVLEEDSVAALVAETVGHFGRLDIMVNNAGVGYLMERLVDMDVADWDAVLGVNLRGVFLGTKHAARQMIKQGDGGRVINIASQAAKSAFAMASAYTASKHGLVGLTRVAAVELAEHQINCNAICPNHVTTGLGAWQNQFFSAAGGKTEAEYLADMRARIPWGRPGLPSDIASACAFLCSDDAVYVTGEAMNVSGGEEYH